MKDPQLSVILPVYNESESISPVIWEIVGVLEGMPDTSWELLAVDDGSTDGTDSTLADLQSAMPQLRVLRLERNCGQSAALWMGFQQARAPWIATLDADGQNDPADLPALWAKRDEADAVFGYRASRQDRWSKRVGSRMANAIRNRILRENIRDTGCSMKLFQRQLTTRLAPWNGMHRFFGTLFLMQGARIAQLPVNHRPRAAGQSKYTNLGRLPKTIRDLMAMRWLRDRYVNVHLREPDADGG